jgi:hypothetical protein
VAPVSEEITDPPVSEDCERKISPNRKIPSVTLHPVAPVSEVITDPPVSEDCERRISPNRSIPFIPLHPVSSVSEEITNPAVSGDCERRISPNRGIPSVIVRPLVQIAEVVAADDIGCGTEKIQCSLILPPDDILIDHEFGRDATITDAITVARQYLSNVSVLRICDNNSIILNPETRLSSLSKPRDLFVKNCIICEIRQRHCDGFSRWEKEVFEYSTIDEILILIENRFGHCKLANDSGQILSSDMKITDSNHTFIAVPSGSECVIDFHLLEVELNGLETDGEAPIGKFVDYQCDLLDVRDRIRYVSDDRGCVNLESKLHTVRGVLRCHLNDDVDHDDQDLSNCMNSNPLGFPVMNPDLLSISPGSASPISNFGGSAVSIAPPSPMPGIGGGSAVPVGPPSPISSSGGSVASVPANDCPIYLFQYEEQEFELPIPTDWTVFQTKEKVALRYHTIAGYVSLIFHARTLKDESLLSHCRIDHKKIHVYLRPFDRSLLESIGYGSRSGVEKPSDFLERVNELESSTGQDRRICSRCLIFYDYDVNRAREALQMIESP